MIDPLRQALGPVARQRLIPATAGPGLPEAPFAPGSTMSAQLIGGDIRLGAVGTTTYVTNDGRVVGFGHPFLGTGATSLVLGGGYVPHDRRRPDLEFQLQAWPRRAHPGERSRTTQTAAVVGTPGEVAAIPVVLRSRDRVTGRRSELHTLLPTDERLAPAFADLLQRESVFRVRDAAFSPGTASMTVIVESSQLGRPLIFRNRYATVGDIAFDSEPVVARIVALLRRNGVTPVSIDRLTVVQNLETRIRAARIVSARLVPARVRPGGRARLRIRIQPWRMAERVVTVPVRVPRGLPAGRVGVRGCSPRCTRWV